jgi:hypothetical protein
LLVEIRIAIQGVYSHCFPVHIDTPFLMVETKLSFIHNYFLRELVLKETKGREESWVQLIKFPVRHTQFEAKLLG